MKWIDTQSGVEEALRAVAAQPAFAIDTEADSLHSYFDKVCLVQISIPGDDFIIDPLAPVDLRALGDLLADPERLKVLHGADYDLRILDRDFGFRIGNLIDTMVSAQLAGYEAFGLSALLGKHFGVELDKSHQRADWAMRPLPASMLRYAALDTHYLLELGDRMRQELEALGRWEWALEEFRRLEGVRWREEEPDLERWRKLKGLSALNRRSLGVVARLHSWRDRAARAADRPPFKILGNETILAIASAMPASEADLRRIRGMSDFVVRKHGPSLLAAVREVLHSNEVDLPEHGARKPWLRDREMERRIDRLKVVRDEAAARLKIDPAVLAPRHVLAAVAAACPSSVEELSSIPAMREWQKSVIGDQLVAALK
jgi:ribonuclease D